jgi:lipopolysaccharide/colanic/teichoic acid biosynthesis glycosyltransferase
MDSIRCFDVLFAFLGIVILLPFFIIIALLIKLTSAVILFKQNRVGKNNVDFKLLSLELCK